MRNPSTGDDAEPPHPADQARSGKAPKSGAAERARDPSAKTRRNVKGRSAPRLPHERDESSDSGTGAPSDLIQRGHDDVVAGKTGGDKGEATEETYRRSLRGTTPGKERD